MEHARRAIGVVVSRDTHVCGVMQPAQRKSKADSATDLSAALSARGLECSTRARADPRSNLPYFRRPVSAGSPHDSLGGGGCPGFHGDESVPVFTAAIREPAQ